MIPEWAVPDWATRSPAALGRALQDRRSLDLAEGILIALRRCNVEAAFHELLGAAQKHCVPVSTIASALVDLASGSRHDSFSHPTSAARFAAAAEWGELLKESSRT
jgi:hypothetical protein